MAKISRGEFSQSLLDFYQATVYELRAKHTELVRVVDDCKELVVKNADREEEALRLMQNSSRLKQALSEMQRCMYKERERALKLMADNDRLRVQLTGDQRKIQFLLSQTGLNEEQLIDSRIFSYLVNPSKTQAPRRRRYQDVKDFNRQIKDFQESLNETLSLRVKSLETELDEQKNFLEDEIFFLEKDLKIKEKEWATEKRGLEQRIACLNCKLQNTQLQKLEEILSTLHDIDKERDREFKLVEENNKLSRWVALSREILGDDFPETESKRHKFKDDIQRLEETLRRKDEIIRGCREDILRLEKGLSELRERGALEKDNFNKDKKKYLSREEFLKRKLHEEKRRRLFESEGFRNDIKLLRSKLQSIERQIRLEKIREGCSGRE